MASENGWNTIESDPGVFSSMLENIGVKGAQVEELFMMDADALRQLSPVFGVIFLFKYERGAAAGESLAPSPPLPCPNGVFFAKQVIQNACATQAIVSVLLNADGVASAGVELGDALTQLRAFGADATPEVRGMALGQSEAIRSVHNSFKRPEPFVFEHSRIATDDDDVYHFVAYLKIGTALIELDGLRPAPIVHATVDADGDGWLDAVVGVVQRRIERYASSAIQFNLMAVVKDRRRVCAERVAAAADESEKAQWQTALDDEHAKRRAWEDENIRRRHDYVPCVIKLLEILADVSDDALPTLLASAKERVRARDAALKAQKEKREKEEKATK